MMTKSEHTKAPMRYAPYALQQFMWRWKLSRPKAARCLEAAVLTAAYPVEQIPDTNLSIWGFVVQEGRYKGEVALMVVGGDGTVRTVLRHEPRPTQRRRKST